MKNVFYRILPLILAAALQVMPLLRSLVPVTTQGLAPSAWSIILKIGAGTVALLGSYHAVSGASVSILPPVNNGFQLNLTNGIFYRVKLAETPYTAGSWTLTATANTTTPTFNVQTGFLLTNLTGYLGGTPTTTSGVRQTNFYRVYVWGAGSEASKSVFAMFTNITFPAIPGSLTVTAGPPALVTLANKLTWSLDGIWQTNASTNIFIDPGSHTINYTNIYGWAAPTNQVITVTSGTQTRLSGVYTQLFGGLKVNIQPYGAPFSNSSWTIDGSPGYASGTVTNLTMSGTHSLVCSALTGYINSAQTITVTNGYTNVINAIYFSITNGTLYVNLGPSDAVSAGAEWQLDGGPWLASGIATNCTIGTHNINFSAVPGWSVPTNTTVTLSSVGVKSFTYNYVAAPAGALQVNLSPPGAVNAGAQWQVDGGALQMSGNVVSGLSAGSHAVAFNAVTGWITPAGQNASVTASLTNTVSASYVPITAPVIGSVSQVGASLVISGTGTPTAGYAILSTNNLAVPATNWPVINTGSIQLDGTFNYTGAVNVAVPATYYRVRSP